MTEITYFHWSLGPVQPFIAASRKIQDLWSGSCLLSYLTAHAVDNILRQHGTVLIPRVSDEAGQPDDPMILAVSTGKPVKERYGTIPNRIMALVPGDFSPEACDEAVGAAWAKLASDVRSRFLPFLDDMGDEPSLIWERQVRQFWQTSWVMGDEEQVITGAAGRKLWRTHCPLPEPGDKCRLFPDLQELSGYTRSASHHQAVQQRAFWDEVGRRLGRNAVDTGEQLSAIGLIKRLFPHVAQEIWGWDVGIPFPSTPYLAAVPWLRRVVEADRSWFATFYESAASLGRSGPSYRHFRSLNEATVRDPDLRGSLSLDGNVFHPTALQAADIVGPPDILDRLSRLAASKAGVPSTYYAILVMDGDRVGELLEHDREAVSRAIGTFARGVSDIVERHDGVLIYAGGDDVLALVPLDDAISLSLALNLAYRQSLAEVRPDNVPTISGAVVYAHFKAPLGVALQEARRLLDERAKGPRNALALGVCREGGPDPYVEWVGPWTTVQDAAENPLGLPALIGGLRAKTVGSSLLHRLARLAQRAQPLPVDWERLVAAEWDSRDENRKQAEPHMVRALARAIHPEDPSESAIHGLLVARFVAEEMRS
jgi:CRISPR-associated protein Cmr2